MIGHNLLLQGALIFSLLPLWALPTAAVTFTPPGDAAPKQSTGGASRDGRLCTNDGLQQGRPFMALTPHNINNGFTREARPTFLVHLPQTTARRAFLSIIDEEQNQHYRTTVALPGRAGIVAITLPPNAPPLQVGKEYQWYVALMCDQMLEPDSPVVSGWVERVPVAIVGGRQRKTLSIQAIARLANEGIWYDTVASLARLRRSQPRNSALNSNWVELLNSVGLGAIATSPLLN